MKHTLRNKHYQLAAIIIITIVAFYPTLFNQFQMLWDDQVHVVNNPFIKTWSADYLIEIFTTPYGYQYSPVNTIVWLITHSMFGLSPMAFHAVSLLLHIINVVLVFIFIRAILNQSEKYKPVSDILATITALVFAIHPVQVEAVAWVSANKVVLHAIFYWAGLLTYISYLKGKKLSRLIITMLLFILSFGAKEQAILFPLSLLIIDWYYGVLSQKRVLLLKIPFFVVALLLGYASLVIFDRTGNGGHQFYPLYQRLVLGAFSYFEYLFKILIPVRVSYLYFFPIKIGEPLPLHFYLYPILAILIVWYVWEQFYKKERRTVVFGLLLFTVHLSLFLHIIPLGRAGMIADRYVYMALPGLILTLTVFIWDYVNKHKKAIPFAISAAAIYILTLTVQTHLQTESWHDSTTLKKELKEQINKAKKERNLPIDEKDDI